MTKPTVFTNLKSKEGIAAASAEISGNATITGNLAVTGTLAATGGQTNAALTDPIATFTINTHNYDGAAADWTLSAAEQKKSVHKVTNANGAVVAIVPKAVRLYVFINTSGQTLTVKTAAGTGIDIANGKTAVVMADGTNVVRITGDA